jgi:uncharacterized damage-inducible protein DinB
MGMIDGLLNEFDHEMESTRKTLERVPEDKFGWKPHEKSGTMIWLAGHIANLPGWPKFTIEQDFLDIGSKVQPPPPPKTTKELLASFEQNVASGRAAIASAAEPKMFEPWTLKADGKVMFSMPRIAVLRSMVMNHLIHHRAQLTVYLRLNDIPVPALYGPSADEKLF